MGAVRRGPGLCLVGGRLSPGEGRVAPAGVPRYFRLPDSRSMPGGVVVAHGTLDPMTQVRILAGQPGIN